LGARLELVLKACDIEKSIKTNEKSMKNQWK
jgi:hypothetical protein